MDKDTEQKIRDRAHSIWSPHQALCGLQIEWENRQGSACFATYNPVKNIIIIKLKNLEHDYNKYNTKLSIEDMVEVSLAHEMGHAKDSSLLEKRKCMKMLFEQEHVLFQTSNDVQIVMFWNQIRDIELSKEETAWELGRYFVKSENAKKYYDEDKTHCLQTYIDEHSKQLEHYLAACKMKRRIQHIKEINGIEMKMELRLNRKTFYSPITYMLENNCLSIQYDSFKPLYGFTKEEIACLRLLTVYSEHINPDGKRIQVEIDNIHDEIIRPAFIKKNINQLLAGYEEITTLTKQLIHHTSTHHRFLFLNVFSVEVVDLYFLLIEEEANSPSSMSLYVSTIERSIEKEKLLASL